MTEDEMIEWTTNSTDGCLLQILGGVKKIQENGML